MSTKDPAADSLEEIRQHIMTWSYIWKINCFYAWGRFLTKALSCKELEIYIQINHVTDSSQELLFAILVMLLMWKTVMEEFSLENYKGGAFDSDVEHDIRSYRLMIRQIK